MLLSLRQYAEKYGKDVGNLNRLIHQGRLPAQKVGSQWVIDEDVKPPEDRRVKSGKYVGWRDNHSSGDKDAKEEER